MSKGWRADLVCSVVHSDHVLSMPTILSLLCVGIQFKSAAVLYTNEHRNMGSANTDVAQVESLLKEKEKEAGSAASTDSPVSLPDLGGGTQNFPGYETYTQPMGYENAYLRNSVFVPDLAENIHFSSPLQNQFFTPEPGYDRSNWALSGLGVQEPLPPQDVMDELSVTCSFYLSRERV